MIPLSKFISAVEANAARTRVYAVRGDGSNGECDCIGLIIGGKRMAGGKWEGKHGSNYAIRNEMQDIKRIGSVDDLYIGEIVYKAREPGDEYYKLPDSYKPDGSSYNGDLRDYYHVGVVTDISPLEITHCTDPGPIIRDKKLGRWKYGGRLKDVDYGNTVTPGEDIGGDTMAETITGSAFIYGGNKDVGINMRQGARKSAALIMKIPQDTLVDVISKGDEWTKIRYKGLDGYVMNEFVHVTEQDDMVPDSLEDRVADLEKRVYALEHQVGFG